MSDGLIILIVIGAFLTGMNGGFNLCQYLEMRKERKAQKGTVAPTPPPSHEFSEEEMLEMKKAREQLMADNEAFSKLMAYGVQQAYGYPTKDR